MNEIEIQITRRTKCIQYKGANIIIRYKKYIRCWLIRLEFPTVEGKAQNGPRCYCLSKNKGVNWAKKIIDAKESKDPQAVLDLIINVSKHVDIVPHTRYILG